MEYYEKKSNAITGIVESLIQNKEARGSREIKAQIESGNKLGSNRWILENLANLTDMVRKGLLMYEDIPGKAELILNKGLKTHIVYVIKRLNLVTTTSQGGIVIEKDMENEMSLLIVLLSLRFMGRSIAMESDLLEYMSEETCEEILCELKNDETHLQNCGLIQYFEPRIQYESYYELEENEPMISLELLDQLTHMDGTYPRELLSEACTLTRFETLQPDFLFLGNKTIEPLKVLSQIMLKDNYLELTTDMLNLCLQRSITCLLYGPAGSGKTEAIYCMAVETQRNIIRVNLMELLGSFGEAAPTLLLEVFSQYNEVRLWSEVVPILLLDGADDLLSGTYESKKSIQFLALRAALLSGIRDISDGIVIVTTRQSENLDPACQSIFLFKIPFFVPNESQRSSIIWNNTQEISEEYAAELAKKFELTGGQIKNAIRLAKIMNQLHPEIKYEKCIQFTMEHEVKFQKRCI